MKKIGIGIAAYILITIVCGVLAHNTYEEFAIPIRILTIAMIVFVLFLCLTILISRNLIVRDSKGKMDKVAIAAVLFLDVIAIATVISSGLAVSKSIADIKSGPVEKTMYFAYMKEREHDGYRHKNTKVYLYGVVVNEDEKSEKVKLRVSAYQQEPVGKTLSKAKWDYDIRAKYKVSYFENLRFLYDLKMIKPDEKE